PRKEHVRSCHGRADQPGAENLPAKETGSLRFDEAHVSSHERAAGRCAAAWFTVAGNVPRRRRVTISGRAAGTTARQRHRDPTYLRAEGLPFFFAAFRGRSATPFPARAACAFACASQCCRYSAARRPSRSRTSLPFRGASTTPPSGRI